MTIPRDIDLCISILDSAPVHRVLALPLTLLPKPALFVRVEEGMHQIVAVIFRNHERLRLNAVVEAHQQLPRQVT